MKITIHRGASQIGGCVTEIRTAKARILIDLGSNLPGSDKPDFTSEEIKKLTEGVDAIFYTHMHGDHVGHMSKVDENIPQYIGEGARDVMLCKIRRLAKYYHATKDDIKAVENLKIYKEAKPVAVKDITVTPYYCSHSAFDSYMFKIEADEITILHTGDFRSHGYLGGKLIPMLEGKIDNVDILITEGTMLSRSSEYVKKENDIQKDVAEVLRTHKCVIALGSSTDIDRLASFQAACKRARRKMVVDEFQSEVLDIFSKHMRAELYKFRKNGLKGTIFENKDNSVINSSKVIRYLKSNGFLITVRIGQLRLIKRILSAYADLNPVLVYSMWNGYYKGSDQQVIKDVQNIRALFPENRIFNIHTSGHADCETLAEVCTTVHPRLAIIPIHKDEKSDFRTLDILQELKDRVVAESTTICGVEIEIK